MEEAADTADEDKTFKLLQCIIPDLIINGRSLSGNGFLAGRKSVAEFHHAALTLTTAPAIPTQWPAQARELAWIITPGPNR